MFNLEGAMGPLTPFWIKWPLVKARLGHLYHYVNGEILNSVLFLFLFDLILYVHSTIFQLCGTGLPGLNQY